MKFLLAILLLFNAKSFSQIINNGSAISIAPGTIVSADSLRNDVGIVANSGNMSLKNNFTNTATVNGSGDYFIGGNWLSSGVFTAGTSTITFNGMALQNVSSASDLYNIRISKTSGWVSLSGNITANGNVNFISGKIQTAANKLIIAATGSVTGSSQATGWVFGNLQKAIPTGSAVHTFETGDSLTYSPSSISFNGVSVSGNLTGFVTPADHPNLNTSGIDTAKNVKRYFTFTNNGIVFTDASVTLNWVAADIDAGASPANFIAAKYSASSWTIASVVSNTPTSLQLTGITSFSDFAVGEAFGPLPVKISSVKAYPKNEGVQVEWTTQFENNINRYEVERSANGQQFIKLGTVQAKGNSSQVLNYNLFDASPLSGINYYRIKSVGIGTDISYSQIVKVNLITGRSEIIFYPNPVIDNNINLRLNNVQKGNYNVSLTNSLGQLVYNKLIQHTGGTATYNLPVNNLVKGIYHLQIGGNGIKIIKQVLKN